METSSHIPVVLIVDDEPVLREVSALALGIAGYSVLEAETADAALDILRSGQIVDLVFTDVQMPGQVNGLALGRIVDAKWPRVKLIVTSGSVLVRAADMPEGGRFLPKPYTLASLTELVSELTAYSQARPPL